MGTIDLQDRLTRSTGDRYAIESVIGRGGMAVVFRARDRRHDRPVALKVVHPDLAEGLAGGRFLLETRMVAGLQHPHIVPLYDSGGSDGLLWFVMPYVDGESLRGRMNREGELHLDDVIEVGCEIADALDYAHRAGIIHRDIKPENILLSGRHAFVADFGIGTAVENAAGDRLTRTGIVIGTPAYMSPEQAEGGDVDARTDLYSLGCVLYEMLAGRRPYEGATPVAVIARRLAGDPVPLRQLRPDLPAGVEQVVARALATRPEDRFASAADLRDELRNSPSIRTSASSPRPLASVPSIAVLPFANMSADPDNEYFSDGMAEELINALTRLPALKVAARTSSFAFKGKNVDLRRVGETLGVTTVLEGSVRHSGNVLRVTAQLIDVRDGFHIWSQRFDRELTDVFAIQDEIAAAIVAQLEVRLTTEQAARPLVHQGTDDLEAYKLYHRGRWFWERRDLQKALASFEHAAARDPGYALPHAGLADGYSMLGYYGFVPSPAARVRASEAAARAVTADPRLAEAQIAAAGAAWFFEYDTITAEAAFRNAVSLNPRSAYAHAAIAFFHGVMGRGDAVTEHGRRALELDVLSPHVARLVGLGHVLAGDHDTGIEHCRSAVELDPGSAVAVFSLGFACTEKGLYDDAIQSLTRAIGLSQPSPLYVMALGYAFALAGRDAEAAALIAKLEAQSLDAYCAWIHAALGDDDAAFRALDTLFEQRNPIGIYFADWSRWARLRSDPRYADIARRHGLDWVVRADPQLNMA